MNNPLWVPQLLYGANARWDTAWIDRIRVILCHFRIAFISVTLKGAGKLFFWHVFWVVFVFCRPKFTLAMIQRSVRNLRLKFVRNKKKCVRKFTIQIKHPKFLRLKLFESNVVIEMQLLVLFVSKYGQMACMLTFCTLQFKSSTSIICANQC